MSFISDLRQICEVKSSELFHTTSFEGLLGILKDKKLKSRNINNSFISFSEVPYLGDISGNDIVLVFNRNKLRNQLIKVEYTKKWYEQYTDQAAYIAGEGWLAQFDIDDWIDSDDIDIETGEVDSDVENEVYAQAEMQAFLDKSSEKEWITRQEMQPVSFDYDDIYVILVPDRTKIDMVKSWLDDLGINIKIKSLR